MTFFQQYENMRVRYRKTQADLKEALELLAKYDGSRAIDEWDENLFPSREWEQKVKSFIKTHKK